MDSKNDDSTNVQRDSSTQSHKHVGKSSRFWSYDSLRSEILERMPSPHHSSGTERVAGRVGEEMQRGPQRSTSMVPSEHSESDMLFSTLPSTSGTQHTNHINPVKPSNARTAIVDSSTIPTTQAPEGSIRVLNKGVTTNRSLMKADLGRLTADRTTSLTWKKNLATHQSPTERPISDMSELRPSYPPYIQIIPRHPLPPLPPPPPLLPLPDSQGAEESLVMGASHRCSYPLRRMSVDNDPIASASIIAQRKPQHVAASIVATPLMSLFPPRRALPVPRGTRVELHVHLAGALRHATIWELMKDKKLKLPGDGSLRALVSGMATEDPVDVHEFAKNVLKYLPAIAGDIYALERVAFELCEDKVKEGVLYMEVRCSPNLLMPRNENAGLRVQLQLQDVVAALIRGFDIAQAELGITVRTILSITIGAGVSDEILNLARDFREKGVVGLDFSAAYIPKQKENDTRKFTAEEVPLLRAEMKIFKQARQFDLHRTVHAGFLGGANMVQRAVDKYHAERIGHGYGVLEDMNVYRKCRAKNIHFECCPWESILISNGPQLFGAAKHPITRFAEDDTNFSISTSHPSVTGTTLQQEYDLVSVWGFTELHLVRSNINALRSSFASETIKKNLMKRLLQNLGLR